MGGCFVDDSGIQLDGEKAIPLVRNALRSNKESTARAIKQHVASSILELGSDLG